MLLSWQSHIGKYLHKCDECSIEFNGPKNKLYCGMKCKAKRNNGVATVNREWKEGITGSYLRNVEIIQSELEGTEGEIITVSIEKMKTHGFDHEAPSTRMIMDKELWYRLGNVAFRPDEGSQEFELYKIPENE